MNEPLPTGAAAVLENRTAKEHTDMQMRVERPCAAKTEVGQDTSLDGRGRTAEYAKA